MLTRNRRNYYRILQVQPDAPAEVIRASYRTLMRELKKHPDLGGSTWDASVLNEAYETLSDPQRRAAYDEELFLKYTKQAVSTAKKPVTPVLCPVCKRALSRKPERGDLCPTCRTPLRSDVAPPPGHTDKRSLARINRSARVRYYASWPGKACQGEMIDFSPKGMRFFCNERLAPQTVLKISTALFEASGTVKNVREELRNGQRCYAVGIFFLTVRFARSRGTFLSTSV